MHKKLVYVATFSLLLLLMDLSYADEYIEQGKARMTLTGNTVEGKFVKQDTRYKMYFHPSGNLALIENKDNIVKGSWSINSNGEVCINLASENCHSIKKRNDDGYNLYNHNGDLAITIDKVILGNPDRIGK